MRRSLVPELPISARLRLVLLSFLVYASLAILVAVLYGIAFLFGRRYRWGAAT